MEHGLIAHFNGHNCISQSLKKVGAPGLTIDWTKPGAPVVMATMERTLQGDTPASRVQTPLDQSTFEPEPDWLKYGIVQ